MKTWLALVICLLLALSVGIYYAQDQLAPSTSGDAGEGDRLTTADDLVVDVAIADLDYWQSELKKRDQLLADLDPSSYAIAATTSTIVVLKHGFKGLSDVRYEGGDDWDEVLAVITPLVPFIGSESVEYFSDSISWSPDGTTTHEFRQTINGIPVLNSKLQVRVDQETGEIVYVFSLLQPDKHLPLASISAAEAIDFADDHARAMNFGENLSHTTPKLIYRRVPGQDRVYLNWEFGIGNAEAHVNAVDGSVTFVERYLRNVTGR